ncbi:PDZ domain-containing protein [Paenibacillus phyllosphaerae]|uniref:PDZ domain-containing protein n=1 Tax=Paenibacillus phyllosphaerae TaxID=274593 RepID=A0A7W5B0Z7_9BACL|nr:hypothetical protein [Paenibacillus phyllosphaerae]MBB3112402.1 PDZ domain-containing protein [Paenibacillus phyllosphaerae]
MSEIPLKPSHGSRKSYRHWIIVLLLLLIPFSIAVFAYWPHYYSFTSRGEIVAVREIDVDGSVHFVYVQEGITRNRYEKYSIGLRDPEAVFTKVDASAKDDFGAMLEFEEDLRDETIHHAFDSASEVTSAPATEDGRDERLQQLIDETSGYYGDSIGLMLGIGLVEEAQREDFSQGGRIIIAGTGTLEADHTVGSVGAIRDKLRTAEAAGTDIFFVPKDKETFLYLGISNEEEAEQTAEELNLTLQVVPVATLEEAIAYLQQLPNPYLRSVNMP